MSVRRGLRFLATRSLTLGLYVLAVIGATYWDDNPNSWRLIVFRLVIAAMFLWWAVDRTIAHHTEDKELENMSVRCSDCTELVDKATTGGKLEDKWVHTASKSSVCTVGPAAGNKRHEITPIDDRDRADR